MLNCNAEGDGRVTGVGVRSRIRFVVREKQFANAAIAMMSSEAPNGLGTSVWLRNLIKPPAGYGIAYVDWAQQEFGIAAALSGDAAMQAAYQSGDPYLAFAKQAGRVPQGAPKATHGPTRELFKQCVLAVQYGMEAESLALRIAQPPIVARDLLRSHRQTYRRFWAWSDAAVDQAMLTGLLHTVFGWPIRIGERSNPRSLRNFPMQANSRDAADRVLSGN